jgi:RNA polymerase sigma factor (sigma-70 family)
MKLEEYVSSPDHNSTAPVDLERLAADVREAVRWSYPQYLGRVHQGELNDFSQQIIVKLIKDDCRRLHSFKRHSSSTTWLQRVVNNHIYRCLCRRRQVESLDEIDQEALIYAPPHDQEIYAAEKRRLLLRALGRLSEQERLLYHLWFVSELAPIEIAAIFRTEVRVIYKRKQTLVLKLTRLVRAFQSC